MRKMSFFSFLGRVLFASLILFSAWQIINGFGVLDGVPEAKEMATKLGLTKAHLSSKLWVVLSNVEVRQARGTTVSLIVVVGVLLFVIRKIFGAYLAFYFVVAGPVLYDIYKYAPEERHFSTFWIEFLRNLALFGALVLFYLE